MIQSTDFFLFDNLSRAQFPAGGAPLDVYITNPAERVSQRVQVSQAQSLNMSYASSAPFMTVRILFHTRS